MCMRLKVFVWVWLLAMLPATTASAQETLVLNPPFFAPITSPGRDGVLDLFYTSKLGQGGSGLGLYIVHNLVQGIFKGSVRLESALDQGGASIFSSAGRDT